MAVTQRSEKTRAAILSAARQLLADRGYEGTTIRAVAARAGIDPSMVIRYYGTKEGLFAAAVDVDLYLPAASDIPKDQVGEIVARHVLRRWEGDLSDNFITLLLRSATTNQAAVEKLQQIFEHQLLKFVKDLTGSSPDSRLRASMVSSHVLGLAYCRYILKLPAMLQLDDEVLVRTLGVVLQHYFTGELTNPPTNSR